MAVTEQTPRNVSIAAPGATQFPYSFKIISKADLLVQVNGVTKTVDVDYTVDGVGQDAGGTVTFMTPLSGGETVVRKRNMRYERATDYQNLGDLRSATLNNDQDAPILMIQQLAEENDRSLRLPIDSTASAELPTLEPLAPLVVNADGTGFEMGSTTLTGDMLLRGALKGYYGPSLVADFGGVGDDATDNAAAFTAAESSSYARIYLPKGTYYTSGSASALAKHYYGPGLIRTSGGDRLPGRFTYLTSRPATGTGSDLNRFFSADLSKVDAEYFLLGSATANLRKGISEPYYESATTPHFQVFTNRSGWSGVTALLASPVASGATTAVLNSVEGFAVNDVVIFLDAATETASAATTITAIDSGTKTITFTPATTTAYIANDRVTHGKRTMNPLYYQQVNHFGGGDAYAHLTRVNVGYTALAGQTHVFFTATGGLYGGELSAESAGVFLTGTEINHIDNGYDIAVVGDIRNFQRTNATGARGAFWIGHQIKSEGSQPLDAGYNLNGKFKAGVDLVKGDFGTDKAAVSMKRGDRIVGNSSATDMAGYSLVGNVIGNAWIEYSSNFEGWDIRVAGNSKVQVLDAEVRVLSADYKVDGGRIYGTALHNNASGLEGAAAHFVGSGTYTPSVTLVSNADSASALEAQYIRVGRVVHVSGQITIDATTASTAVTVEISLPIATTLAGGRQLAGTIATSDVANGSGRVFGNITSHRAALQIIAPGTGAYSYSYHFSYLVN